MPDSTPASPEFTPAKPRMSPGTVFLFMTVFSFVLGALVLIYGWGRPEATLTGPRTAGADGSPAQDKPAAWLVAMECVRRSQAAAGSVDFGAGEEAQDTEDRVLYEPDGRYVVTGWVDVRGADGNVVRKTFMCALRDDGQGGWKQIQLLIE